jgi:hypothetical protein
MNPQVTVYDNGGTTFDRYTVIIGDAVFGMSMHPRDPQGFNQYCCQLPIMSTESLGLQVPLHELPEEVRKAILERIADMNEDE